MEFRQCESTRTSGPAGASKDFDGERRGEDIMRPPDEKEIEKLERALLEAYRFRPDTSTDKVNVAQCVMRDIRSGACEMSRWTPSVVLDELVWRTATIAAAVVLVMTVLT